jgi:hypothetical protein
MNDILMVSHFHKDFPFNHYSSWMRAAFAGGKYPYGYNPPGLGGNWTNTTQQNSIHEYMHYYSGCHEDEFLRAMGQQASEYYLWKYGKADFIGCTTYRRYLKLDDGMHPHVVKIVMEPTQQHADYLSSDIMRDRALTILQNHDIITNRLAPLPCSVIDQYLQSQPKEYLDLFLDGIRELMPDYRSKMDWWTGNQASFETCYIMRKQLFKKYVSELFELLEYVWSNTKTVYPRQATTSEPLPWRYPGFLGERFLPFFIYANDANAFRVPLVILE